MDFKKKTNQLLYCVYQDRDKKSSRLENSGMTEEELLKQQEQLFAQSRLKYQAQQQS